MKTAVEIKERRWKIIKTIIIILFLIGTVDLAIKERRKNNMMDEMLQQQAEQYYRQKERTQKIQVIKDSIFAKIADRQMAKDELKRMDGDQVSVSALEKEKMMAAQSKKIDELQKELDKLTNQLTGLEDFTH